MTIRREIAKYNPEIPLELRYISRKNGVASLESKWSLRTCQRTTGTTVNLELPEASTGLSKEQLQATKQKYATVPEAYDPIPRAYTIGITVFLLGLVCLAIVLLVINVTHNPLQVASSVTLLLVEIGACVSVGVSLSYFTHRARFIYRYLVQPAFQRFMESSEYSVVRDGVTLNVAAKDLLIGDVITLHVAQVSPGDLRVLAVNEHTQVDCSLYFPNENGAAGTLDLVKVRALNPSPQQIRNGLGFFEYIKLSGSRVGMPTVVNYGERVEAGKVTGVIYALHQSCFVNQVLNVPSAFLRQEEPAHAHFQRWTYTHYSVQAIFILIIIANVLVTILT